MIKRTYETKYFFTQIFLTILLGLDASETITCTSISTCISTTISSSILSLIKTGSIVKVIDPRIFII